MDEDEGWLRVGVAAALAREYAADQRGMFAALARMLEQTFPGETRLERRGGWFAHKELAGVSLELGDDRYSLKDPGRGALKASRTRVVRGIALKTEELPVEVWLESLAAALEERARANSEIRAALSRFVG